MGPKSVFTVCPAPEKLNSELIRLKSYMHDDNAPTSTSQTEHMKAADSGASSRVIDILFGHFPPEKSWLGTFCQQAVVLQIDAGVSAREVANRLTSQEELAVPSFNSRLTGSELAEIIRAQNSDERANWPSFEVSGPSRWSSPFSNHRAYDEESKASLTYDGRLSVISDRESGGQDVIRVSIGEREGGWRGAFTDYGESTVDLVFYRIPQGLLSFFGKATPDQTSQSVQPSTSTN